MVAPNYLVDGLITSVRTKYIQPNSQNLYQDADVVLFLDECLRDAIVPFIIKIQESYWVTNFDQAITGAASYTIPQRSAAGILQDVVFVDNSGNEIELTKLDPAQIKGTFPFGFQLPLYTFGYYMQDDQIFLYPQQAQLATQYTLRQKFFRRPNNLTLSSNCGLITAINGNIVTVNAVDSTWTTATTFDVIQNFPQFKSVSDGLACTLISNLNITLANVTNLAVGMYLCPSGMSCIPQIPYEAFSLLIQCAIERMAESLGDSAGATTAQKRGEIIANDLLRIISPRVQKATKKIINRNVPPSWGNMWSRF